MPPLTIENAGALVSGGVTAADIQEENRSMQAAPKVAVPATLKGVVERAFYYQGKATKVGEEVTLPRLFALEMEAVKKLRLIKEPAKPAPAAEAKDADAAGKKDKESRYAR